ncbi:MAG TPA: phosphopentomutase [Clostridiaceae bacterium]|nr:phosphopentomutase [Clostridiaceae bacterium]HBG37682.1 phosphopentomutase [Clostridiaceae bacterium]HBN28749.1 phosphopentomutase [Clostridiaceae bacterium]
MKRVILIVLDSVGIGELPDAALYGDEGSNTVGNISKAVGGLKLPNMQKIGFGNIDGIKGIDYEKNPSGCYGRCTEISKGKDTTTGHWEIAGLPLYDAFPTYPSGFPDEVVKKLEEAFGTKIIGNKPASGTVIIQELGDEHVKTGYPIVYTSADSVLQIAAHEEVIPLERLYELCRIARKIMTGKHAVGRIIARPFIGGNGKYTRTSNRRDFSLKPNKKTMLNYIMESGLDVCAVGKIEDIYAGCGITDAVHTKNNLEGIEKTIEYINKDNKGLIFTNLVDFDMLYGHRNDVKGYANALREFDAKLPQIISSMKDTDMLIITADHGCDPTTPSTDHSREYIPVLLYGKELKKNINIGTRKTYSDIGKTITDILNVKEDINGVSFAKDILL